MARDKARVSTSGGLNFRPVIFNRRAEALVADESEVKKGIMGHNRFVADPLGQFAED
jgi:hypothetical protein